MSRKKLTIRREGYTRKGGIHVKAATFKIRDRGHPGRTPKSKTWATWEKHTGWKKTQNADTRRAKVFHSTSKDLSKHKRNLMAYHKLDQLAKVSTDRATKLKARADAEYFRRKLK
jgi:hypothetical protein